VDLGHGRKEKGDIVMPLAAHVEKGKGREEKRVR